MMISKSIRAVAGALALALSAGCLSAYAFQQEPANDAPKEESELSALVKSYMERSQKTRAELEKLGREYDQSMSSVLGRLMQFAAPAISDEVAKDDPDPVAAAKSRLEKFQRAVEGMDDPRRKYHEKLESMLKDLEELGDQIERASGKAKPKAEPPAAADNEADPPRYLPTDRPAVVPSEDGHVVTIFRLPWWTQGEKEMDWLPDEMRKNQEAAWKAAYAPKSVRLAEAGSPRLEASPRFSRRPSGRQLIALALRGEKVQRLAVFDPEISVFNGNLMTPIQSRWIIQDLPEPVSVASPAVGKNMLAYVLGNRIHTYRFGSGKWDVLELPESARPTPPMDGFDGLALEYKGIIYSYNPPTGEWTEIDTRVVPDKAKAEE